MVCIVWDETSHPGYCRYSWGHDILLDYPAHENYHTRPAPSYPGHDTVGPAPTELVAPRVAQRFPKREAPLSIETVFRSGDGDTP